MALIDVIGLNKAPIEKSRISDEITGGLQAGIGLATAKEQVEEKKIQVAQQKEQLEMGKINSFNGMIKTLNMAKPAIAKQMAPKIKERFQAMGFDPAIIDTVMADPDFGRALFNIANEHGSELSATPENRAKMLSAYQDIGLLSDGVNYIQDVKKQSQQNKFAMEQQARQIQGQKDVAAIGAQKEEKKAKARNSDDVRIANSKLNSELTPVLDSLEKLNKVDLFLEGGGLANTAAQRELAMTFNKGALSESDAQLFQGNRSLMDRFSQLMSTSYDGELTKDNIKEIESIIKTTRESSTKRLKSTIEDRAQSFAKTYDMDVEEVRDIFTPHQLIKFTKPSGGGSALSLKQAIKNALTKNPSADPAKLEQVFTAKGLK